MKRAILVAAVLFGSLARAQQPDLLTLGKQEFESAKKEFNLGHYEKALEHFETSYRLTAAPELLFNLGLVKKQLFARTRKLEYVEQAIEHFKAYIASGRAADPKRRELVEGEQKEAEDWLAKERASRAQGEEALKLGEEFVAQGRLPDAQAQLDTYERTPNNERPGVVRAHLLRCALEAGKSNAQEATDACGRALELDANATLPNGTPEAAGKALAAAQALALRESPLLVAHSQPGSLKAGQPVEVGFTVNGDRFGLVTGIQLFYRLGGGKAFSSLQPQPAGKISLPRVFTMGVLPGSKIEYYGVVLDKNHAVLQHLGSDALPFAVQVEQPRGPSVAKKWWFWTAMVAAAGVAAGAIAVGVTLSQPAPPINVPFHAGVK